MARSSIFLLCLLIIVCLVWVESLIFFSRNPIFQFCDNNQQVKIIGKIIQEPVVFTLKTRIKIKTELVENHKINAIVVAYGDNKIRFLKSQEIEWQGALESTLSNKNIFWRQQGVAALGETTEMTIIKPVSFYNRFLADQKDSMRTQTKENISYPLNNLLLATILGDNFGLPGDVKTSLNQSGLRHIISISGTHITIIMSVLISLLFGLGLNRKQAGWLTIFLIFFYIFLIGSPAPAVRSAIMGMGIILAQILGRLPDASRFLLFAAAILLIINPFLIFDVGFWLSFTATAGIVFASRFLTSKIKKVLKINWLSQILGTTFSAQIFSLPVMLYFFGSSPIFSFVANMLVAPIIPFIIMFGFCALIFGLIFAPLSFIFFGLSQILLSYFIFISDICSKILPLSFNFQINIVLVFACYVLLGFWVYHIREKEKLAFLESY